MKQDNHSNTLATLKHLIKELKINVNSDSIEKNLLSHPFYPSILSNSDYLNDWNIKKDVYRIEKEDYSVDDLLFPFIAHLSENGGYFILVHKIENGVVTLSEKYHKYTQMPERNFLLRWSGAALYAEAEIDSTERDFKANRIKQTLHGMILPAAIVLLLSILYVFFSSHAYSWPVLSLTLIKLSGVLVTISLLFLTIDSQGITKYESWATRYPAPFNENIKTALTKQDSGIKWQKLPLRQLF